MNIQTGRRVALAVDAPWYNAIQEHRFLKNGQTNKEHPTDLLTGQIESLDDPNGLWIKPSEYSSDYPAASLFVPWRFIVGAMLLGPDDEKRFPGFDVVPHRK